MNDENGEHSWIEYFLWELDFGNKNKELQVFRQDNSIIDLSDAGKLYDFLMEKYMFILLTISSPKKDKADQTCFVWKIITCSHLKILQTGQIME